MCRKGSKKVETIKNGSKKVHFNKESNGSRMKARHKDAVLVSLRKINSKQTSTKSQNSPTRRKTPL